MYTGATVANEMSSVIDKNPIDVSLDTFADRLFDSMVDQLNIKRIWTVY